jgi:glycosyltransferase involved in cell wall biosynthesis
MRIVFLASHPVDDVRGWSGIPYFAFRQCRKRFAECIAVETPILDWLIRCLRPIFICLGIDIYYEHWLARLYAAVLAPRIDRLDPAAVIAIASSQKIGWLQTKAPIIHVSDATFRALVGYYPGRFSRLTRRSIALGDRLERHVLENCAVAALASRWAAESVVGDYGLPRDKVRVVPIGANIDGDPRCDGGSGGIEGTIILLLVGVAWERKGGPLALRVLTELQRRGVAAELHVVGCEPPHLARRNPAVVCHGFLDKSDPAQLRQLERLYERASLLIGACRQEAYGVMFAEASAHGLPVLATNTGGIPTVVEDGVNGFLFDLDAPETFYVDKILALRAAPDQYRKLRAASRKRYVSALSWDAWGRGMAAILAEMAVVRDEPRRLAASQPGAAVRVAV